MSSQHRAPGGAARLASPAASRLIPMVVAAFLVAVLFQFVWPLTGGRSWLVYVQDDFFYYLQVARNLAEGHGSTFNGLVATNGYHPLWMLTLAAVCRVSTNEAWLGAAVMGITFVAIAATALLAEHLLRACEVRGPARMGLALCFAASCLTLFYCGMEITLTLPLLVGVMLLFASADRWRASVPAGVGAGLVLSATILSRLDSGLFVLMLLAGVAATPEVRRRMNGRLLLGAAIGLAPVLVYLLSNQYFFHTWMPVSGMAKQIRSTHVPAAVPLSTMFSHGPKALARLLPSVAGLALLAGLRRQIEPAQRMTLFCALVFPLLHVLMMSVVSDWLLWPWYLYGVRLSVLATIILLARLAPVASLLQRGPVALAIGAAAVLLAVMTRYAPHQEPAMAVVAEDLVGFARTHPGVYAMGDRAGIAGYLLPQPLVQTEGLMMDRRFVEFIRAQTPLREVLRHYGVRYFVATVHGAESGCFEAVEPWQAGPTSPHMRATFCEPPVARFTDGDFPTLVFDLERGGQAAATQSVGQGTASDNENL